MKKFFLSILVGATIISCTKDDVNPETNGPATEHHTNDKVKDKGNGTTGVTLGNVDFTTKQRDFSGEAVVTDPKTVSANKEDEYPLTLGIRRFKIDNDYIVASETKKILLYDMNNKVIKDERATDFDVTGFDFNGAIMTTQAGTNVDFYKINEGKIEKHFFHIERFKGSIFIDNCYLDHDRGYVYNTPNLLSFPLDNVKDIRKEAELADFAKINYTSDEKNIYISMGQLSKPDPNDPNAPYLNYSEIKILEKSNSTSKNEITSALDIIYSGITVDANYIYLSVKDRNEILVYNKHTFKASGKISTNGPTSIEKVGEYLYAYSTTSQSVIKYKVSFK
jgi:hypothetical protein